MSRCLLHYGLVPLALALSWATASWGAEDAVDFASQIRPLLSKKCFACHGPDEHTREGGLRLDVREAALQETDSGELAIVPGKSDESHLLARITSDDEYMRMPPEEAGEPLTPEEVELLRRWIDQGADYSPHWAYRPLVRPELPTVQRGDWPRSGLDYFVLARLEREGLAPSPEADRYTLMRRVALDLTGLPPTPAEVDAFVNDKRPDAYERLVDRLLNSPAYGERMARMWLDLARYADTDGYEKDQGRTIWRYRDWVIDAFNRDLPYDQFTIEQLAGDLLPDPTMNQLCATAFHRNTMTNTEGGTDDEEFRVAAVVNRVNTTMLVWMGTTIGCAQCHNHKFDPLTQREFFELYAYFNQTADNDLPSNAPVMPTPTRAQQAQMAALRGEIAELEKQFAAPRPELAAAQRAWEAKVQGEIAWQTLPAGALHSQNGATLAQASDGSILASGPSPDSDTYTISAAVDAGPITAIRLEVLPDPSLPKQGPGRHPAEGDFVLSQFSAEWIVEQPQPRQGRFVRIELPGENRILSLAEVQVWSGGKNIAPSGRASQASVDYLGPAELAIDGGTSGDYAAKSVTHTARGKDPWWELDLGSLRTVGKIDIWNRTDGGVGDRLNAARVQLLDAERQVVWEGTISTPAAAQQSFRIGHAVQPIALSGAFADANRPQFDAGASLKNHDPGKHGWAVNPRDDHPHEIVYLVESPATAPGTAKLRMVLDQRHEKKQATLGRFRLSVTTDPRVASVVRLPAEVRAILAVPESSRTAAQRAVLDEHYRSIAPQLAELRRTLAKRRQALAGIKPPTTPIMRELPPDQRRTTHIHERGNFLSLGEEVSPGVPEAFHPLPEGPPNRLTLARWLVDPHNPLTPRVAANRFWEKLFGLGIVETSEDFGAQGTPPTHPELLDWLAAEFLAQDWSMKQLVREIVTSATYRQSSRVSPQLLEKDPRNELLARGPRFRLEAEMVRDQALAASGLLSREIYGPSVMPPQPNGVWQIIYNGQQWSTSAGSDKYRRGLYTYWRRTSPYPSMMTFDATSREVCTIRRIRTNTPLQALVTMNDPVYVEAAQGLARRAVREAGSTVEERAGYMFRLALVRPPRAEELERLVALYQSELDHYRAHPEAAKQLVGKTLGPPPAGLDAAELAAWTVVGNVVFNLDEALTKD